MSINRAHSKLFKLFLFSFSFATFSPFYGVVAEPAAQQAPNISAEEEVASLQNPQSERRMYYEIYVMLEPEKAKDLDFDAMTDEEFSEYKTIIDSIAMALMKGQFGDAKGAQAKKSKFPVRWMVTGYALWRNWFNVFAHDREFQQKDGVVPEWLKRFDKYIVRPGGSLAAVWEELQKAGIDSPDALLQAMATDQNLPYELQVTMRQAYNDSAFFERRFPLVGQLAIKFAPSLLYHWLWQKGINRKTFERQGGYRLTECRYPSSCFLAMTDSRSTKDSTKGEYTPASLKLLREYEQGQRWSVPLIGDYIGMSEAAARAKWEKDRAFLYNQVAGWKVSMVGGHEKHERSDKLVDSSLYQTAATSAVDLITGKLYENVRKSLYKKVGRKKVNNVVRKTYGIISPDLIYQMCNAMGRCLLHASSNSQFSKDYLGSVVPQFRKDRLGICDRREVNLGKTDVMGWRYSNKVTGSKEIGYTEYVAKQIARSMMYNFASFIVPQVMLGALRHKKTIASWIGDKITSFGNLFIKIGLCSENPMTRLGNALSNRVQGILATNPATLSMMVQMIAQADQAQAQNHIRKGDFDAYQNAMKATETYAHLAAKLERIAHIKQLRYMYQVDYLALRSDKRCRKLGEELEELNDDVMQMLKTTNLTSRLVDQGTMTAIGYLFPMVARWGVSSVTDYASKLGRNSLDVIKERYA